MERSQLFDLMGELQLYGMKAAFDEIMATAVKRQHEPQRIIGDLLTAEINEKQAHSIKYQLSIAKLPLAKDLDDFAFDDTPINETLVRDLAGGGFLAQQRNAVLIGGTGTGKTHLAIAIARSCISAPMVFIKAHLSQVGRSAVFIAFMRRHQKVTELMSDGEPASRAPERPRSRMRSKR